MDYACVFFLHLPKTGGTTMRRVLARQYFNRRCYDIGEDVTGDIRKFRATTWEPANTPSLVQGHMSFGLDQYITGNTGYLTLLREPIRRALSDYHYVTSTPSHPIYPHVKDLGLLEYFGSGITGQLSNGQVRLISGDTLPNDPGVPSKRAMERPDLDRALDNLHSRFIAVGLLERFDETLLLFRRRLGWGRPFYLRENVTIRPYRQSETTEAEVRRLRELNSLDIELYEAVTAEFDRHVRDQGWGFKRELSTFRVLNKAWGFLVTHLPVPVRQSLGKVRRGLMGQ